MCWEDLHSLAECYLASTGLLCEQWNSTLGIRHSQFAYTIGGSILWSAAVSRGGAECLFFFRFTDSLENGTSKRFSFFSFLHSLFLCCLEAPGITQARQTVSLQRQHPKRGKHHNYFLERCYHTKLHLHKHFLLQTENSRTYNFCC